MKTTRTYTKRIVFCILFLIGTGSDINGQETTFPDTVTTAQDTIPSDSISFIKTDNVEVIKAFEAKLVEADRQGVLPQAPSIKTINRKYEYDVTIIPYDIIYPEPVIKPIAMRRDDPIKFYKNYIKAGYGNLKNALGQLQLSHKFSDLIDWNASVRLESADNSQNIPHQKYYDFRLSSIQEFTVMETSKISTSLELGRENRGLFYNVEDRINAPEAKNLDRNIDRLGIGLDFFNTVKNNVGVDYNIAFKTALTRLDHVDDPRLSELNTSLFASITKLSNKSRSITFAGGVDANSISSESDLIASFTPNLLFSGNKLSLGLGLSYVYADSKSYAFPDVLVGYALDDKLLQLFIGSTQNYHRNNYRNTLAYNPFSSGMDSLSTNITTDIFGGVKGDAFGVKYSAKAGYKDISNQSVFNVDFDDSSRPLIASVADLKSIYISGTLEMPVMEWINVGGSVTQNFFSDVSTEELWHIPSLELSAYADISLMDNLIHIHPTLFLRDRVNALTKEGENIELDDLIDFNLEVRVNPTDQISIWARGINLFDKSYRRWYGYENFGIHAQGGLSVKF